MGLPRTRSQKPLKAKLLIIALVVSQISHLRGEEPDMGSSRGGGLLFGDEELKDMTGVSRGVDFLEVICGCTSRRYGDAVGKLRVFGNGDLFISCDCTPGCKEDHLTPSAFEKHSGRDTSRRWKSNVWVFVRGKKVPLLKTALLRYHNQASSTNGSHKRHKSRPFHRDEFLTCTSCNKKRRYRLRTQEECRIYHDAQQQVNWKCSDLPVENITCEDEEERSSRRRLRGCPRAPSCKGCTSCVCFGCAMCRFSDCSCKTCVDFIDNADPV